MGSEDCGAGSGCGGDRARGGERDDGGGAGGPARPPPSEASSSASCQSQRACAGVPLRVGEEEEEQLQVPAGGPRVGGVGAETAAEAQSGGGSWTPRLQAAAVA